MRAHEEVALAQLAREVGALVVHMDRQTKAAEETAAALKRANEILDEIADLLDGDDDDDGAEPSPDKPPMEKVSEFLAGVKAAKDMIGTKPS